MHIDCRHHTPYTQRSHTPAPQRHRYTDHRYRHTHLHAHPTDSNTHHRDTHKTRYPHTCRQIDHTYTDRPKTHHIDTKTDTHTQIDTQRPSTRSIRNSPCNFVSPFLFMPQYFFRFHHIHLLIHISPPEAGLCSPSHCIPNQEHDLFSFDSPRQPPIQDSCD